MTHASTQTTRSSGWQTHVARIESIEVETSDVKTYTFRLCDQVDFGLALPGQFNMLYLPGVGEAAISLSDHRSSVGGLVHTVRAVGNVTRTLDGLSIGDSIGVRGPFGSAWPIETCRGRDLLLVAGGIGLAPLRPVVHELIDRKDEFGRVCLLIGARTPHDLLYFSEYDEWCKVGIEVDFTVDHAPADWTDDIGVVTLLVDRLQLDRPADTVLMTCGPEVMMTYAIQSALELGIDRRNVWLSLERNMNCAVGTCGHCQFGPQFLCKDGPVLGLDRVDALLEVSDL